MLLARLFKNIFVALVLWYPTVKTLAFLQEDKINKSDALFSPCLST
jgi:hypothetical protein